MEDIYLIKQSQYANANLNKWKKKKTWKQRLQLITFPF